MSTTQAALVETISKPQLRGLPSRKAAGAERLNKIRDLASAVPQGLIDIVDRLMQKAPEARYGSTAEVVEAFTADCWQCAVRLIR